MSSKPTAPIDHAAQNRRFHADAPDADAMGTRAPLDTMPTGSFSSSNVHSGLYDYGDESMYIRYKRDGPDVIYRYWNVPSNVWNGLKAANSKGSYVNQYIAYEYRYALYGRDDFPDRAAMDQDLLRRFVYDP